MRLIINEMVSIEHKDNKDKAFSKQKNEVDLIYSPFIHYCPSSEAAIDVRADAEDISYDISLPLRPLQCAGAYSDKKDRCIEQ